MVGNAGLALLQSPRSVFFVVKIVVGHRNVFAQQPPGGAYNAGFGDLTDEEGVDPLRVFRALRFQLDRCVAWIRSG